MKDEKITKTAYIANSGGLLGLCMGFSLGTSILNFFLLLYAEKKVIVNLCAWVDNAD